MTVFIASLFLPKTVHFDLPGTPPLAAQPPSLDKEPKKKKKAAASAAAPGGSSRTATAVEEALSLFTPQSDITPPDTPTEDQSTDPFANEDGIRIGNLPTIVANTLDAATSAVADAVSKSTSKDATPAERGSPAWGTRRDQPKSRANSPPPALLNGDPHLTEKAKELHRQGITQPRTYLRSDSHDRIFSSANWRIVNSDQGNGGLRNAAAAAAREGKLADYTWVGTLGMPTDALENTQQKEDINDRLAAEHNMLTVWCEDKDFDGHYVHFCKQILWPVFHYQIPDNPRSKAYEDHSWKYYVNVNQAFADIIIKNWKRGDVVWIHDYHLLLVPGMIRQKLPDAKIGFFLHVAFPSSEIFRCLAVRKELLDGILGANLVGFQIHEYTRHFLQTVTRLLNAEATSDGIQLEDRFVDVVNMPIGIDPVALDEHREEAEVMLWLNVLREKYEGKKLIVARDKLDHIRGVRQKLLSYELFLNLNPEWRGRVVLIQVALSSSDRNELDATVSDIVTRVNSLWANLAYQPVVYLRQDIDYPQYLALLTDADALMITSQREGMNLTSHEYVFCQDGKHFEKKHGSLILSEFTGTSELFHGSELAINPWDYRACADAIKKALEMDEDEKNTRWSKLYEAVRHHTGSHWFAEFLSRLDRVYDEQHRRDQTSVPRLSMHTLISQYKRTSRRLFILDYEGTLVSWGPVNKIIPVSPQRTLDVLRDLLLDERNTVYVMSGRSEKELDRLFRQVPNVGLIAENGCFLKHANGGGANNAIGNSNPWIEMADPEQIRTWKESVKQILTYYKERTPGAEIEDRRCSLIFHYKSAEDYESATRLAADCASHINDSCEEQRVHAIPLDGSILVEPVDWTKGTAAAKIHEALCKEISVPSQIEDAEVPATAGNHGVDFLMVVGDGRDDDKVFKWANQLGDEGKVKEVVTVSLGSRSTEAAATMTQGVSGVLVALSKLANLE
ncbi:alpha,alpha-trehalose-phosphate synthase (UDP-forming) [Sporothrix schenckii 1099-18]|uniref:Trehalose-phosphatase n=2 Tax=Sporothrix schenckii TaxID=29908 RepID=U7PYV0_SPOS1|nr:alpha,alpha-trehalose-phosphate synthase (UDP-forming) [Sporothrix schenckii 1099-18]ERS99655.1 trehalose-phosphatase [Sporothrix schenckii ATCC 58251]KJR85991.1 alpha,alpha-trehalose-phosphate synthase (UDP-forming) [Sporothrix schenckii 1099-18]